MSIIPNTKIQNSPKFETLGINITPQIENYTLDLMGWVKLKHGHTKNTT